MPIDRRHLLAAAAAGCLPAARAAGRDGGLPLLLAREAPPDVDPAPFLVSEKFDGVRALWDGRRLRLRGGGEVAAPAAFVERLPPQPLDGELWLGHGRFEATSGLVRRARPQAAGWAALRYQVFELPGAPGPFSERAARLQALVADCGHPQLRAVPQQRVADRAALRERLQAVLAAGGEGLVLHRADAPYLTGRSEVLLKLKPLHDAEAEVLAHEPGRGRLAGLVGALRVRNAEGAVFSVGSGLSDALRAAPPPVGSWITYAHRGHTAGGQPRFPTFLRGAHP